MDTIKTFIGEFTYDETCNWYELKTDTCRVEMIPGDNDQISEATLATLQKYGEDLGTLDKKIREHIAANLLDSANDWQEDADEEPLTAEQFAGRITLTDLIINPDGSLDAYYDDDDIFWGHCIVANIDVNGEVENADIAG